MKNQVKIIGLKDFPLVNPGDDISSLIISGFKANNLIFEDGDIILIAQTIISKSNGRLRNLKNIRPSSRALEIYQQIRPKSESKKIPVKSPEHIQAILDESKELLKIEHVLITETKHGFICANAGIDKSNVEGKDNIALLPENPDDDARAIALSLKKATNKEVAVIITDSFGRPFRIGAVGVAVGVSGIRPERDERGSFDLFGHSLESTIVGQVDNLASAAQLVMGEANEGLPVILVKGYKFQYDANASIKSILRDRNVDLFRDERTSYEFEKLLKRRRSYKLDFSAKSVDIGIIEECINLARWAPSAHNGQFWRYLVIERGETRERLIDKMNEKLKEDLVNDGKPINGIKKKIKKTRDQFLRAPYLLLACMDSNDLEKYNDSERMQNEFIMGIQSVSASITYLLLALESKGLVSCWYCAPLFTKKIVNNYFNLPDTIIPLSFITIGYASTMPLAPKRKDLSKIKIDVNNKIREK